MPSYFITYQETPYNYTHRATCVRSGEDATDVVIRLLTELIHKGIMISVSPFDLPSTTHCKIDWLRFREHPIATVMATFAGSGYHIRSVVELPPKED